MIKSSPTPSPQSSATSLPTSSSSSTSSTSLTASPPRDFIDVLCHAMELFPHLGAPGLSVLRATCSEIRDMVDDYHGWKLIVANLNSINTFNIVKGLKEPFIIEEYILLPAEEQQKYAYGGWTDDNSFASSDPRIHKAFRSLPPYIQCSQLFPFCAAAVNRIQALFPVSFDSINAREDWDVIINNEDVFTFVDHDVDANPEEEVIENHYTEAYGGDLEEGSSFRFNLTYRLIDLQIACHDLAHSNGTKWYRGEEVVKGEDLAGKRRSWSINSFKLNGRCMERGIKPCSDEHIEMLTKPTKSKMKVNRLLCEMVGNKMWNNVYVLSKAKRKLSGLIKKANEEES